MSLFEIRQYPVKEGGMDEWVAFMENNVTPFIESKGMKVNAMFKGVEDPNLYVFIRQFDNEAHRAELYKAVYESEDWQQNYKPTVRRLVDVENAVIHVVENTKASPLT